MRDSALLVAVAVLAGFFAETQVARHEILRLAMIFPGFFLTAACAVGRLYVTAFIGGTKNLTLITHGPYSLCRNPLYFCTLLGVAGIGLLSCSLLVFAAVMGGFFLLYSRLIAREEDFLAQKFGGAFAAYKEVTPRLWPSLKNHNCPEELAFRPRFLAHALRDCIWWFAAWPVFESARALQKTGVYSGFLPLF